MQHSNRLSIAILAAVVALGGGCISVNAEDEGTGWGWGGEKASRDISRTIDRGKINNLKIRVGAGKLEIRGESRADFAIDGTITGYARKTARAEEILAEVELHDLTRGDTLTLEAKGPENLNNEGYAIDLVLIVPDDIALDVEDGSGNISVENVQGGIRIDDGSGAIELGLVGGKTRISDGSGEIIIRDLDTSRGGSGPDQIRISDGSGEIEMKDIVGEVRINDGSGEIVVTGLYGSIEIEDGSGAIRLDDVTGSVEITDGSGSMRIENILGDVGITDGSGGIKVDEISGDRRVHSAGSGGIDIGRFSGSVEKP
jgi:hypothetical protein